MGVDKFGRYTSSKSRSIRGPKGDGFKLTSDGHYDIQEKRLVNLIDPVEDGDAINKRSVLAVFNNTMRVNKDGMFNAHSKKIVNLKDPTNPNDVANKKYIDAKVPELGKEAWAFKRKRLSYVADPKYDGEAVTLGYLKNNTLIKSSNGYNANNNTIFNLGPPINDGDAICKSYFEKNTIPLSSTTPRQLSNIDAPTLPKDAVNLDYLNSNAIVKAVPGQPDWDARFGKIKYLSNPNGANDAVNKAYLEECIADLSYAIYSELMTMKNTFNLRVEYASWMAQAFKHPWGDMFKMHR